MGKTRVSRQDAVVALASTTLITIIVVAALLQGAGGMTSEASNGARFAAEQAAP